MTQKELIIEILKKNNGSANLNTLYEEAKKSDWDWDGKTPEASIRNVLNTNPDLFSSNQRGVWRLKEYSPMEYENAAHYLKNYVQQNNVDVDEHIDDVNSVYADFMNKFSPERLAELDDNEVLDTIFYSATQNTNDCLCYYLEVDKACKEYMGSISGGSAYKFGLFKNKETQKWTMGSARNKIELTEEEALKRGKEIRDSLVRGAKAIADATLETLEDYENLHEELKETMLSDVYDLVWVHKYLSMVYPEKLSHYHADDFQKKILYELRIKPSEKMYARSGQIALVSKLNGWNYHQFALARNAAFGDIRRFYRLGSSDGEKNYYSEWFQKGIVALGWNKAGSLNEYAGEKFNKDALGDRLKEEYYPSNASTASRKAGEMRTFYEIDPASAVFVVMNGNKLIAFVDGLQDYEYDADADMSHIRKGKWHAVFAEDERLPIKDEGHMTSCREFRNEENLMYLYDKYYYADTEYQIPVSDDEQESSVKEVASDDSCDIAKNTILYGPPGTGKTYNTVYYSVAICENRSLSEVMKEEYVVVHKRFDDYKRQGRIAFTTFHQSYGYEEFIEGIRPEVNSETNAVEYNVEDGVFKEFCELALLSGEPEVNYHATTYIVRLGSVGENDLKTQCFNEGVIRFDWPEKPDENGWIKWLRQMSVGDYVLSYYGQSENVDGIGVVVDDEPYYDEEKPSFRWTRRIKWLKTGFVESILEANNGKYLSNFQVGRIPGISIQGVLNIARKQGVALPKEEKKPYVFVIDEINRGNISKVFGELITLIEDTKRIDASEEIRVTLPYSGGLFGVPDNVYILGTMNTADRSIALMDTALRRRFNFVECMPDETVLKDLGANVVSDGNQEFDVEAMLHVMNERITYLYDREHTLGHAFFTPLKDDPTIDALAVIFKNKIIPLLQEYFYDDYEKIQLVLGDNSKPAEYKFILDENTNEADVFNKSAGLDDLDIPPKKYSIQEKAFFKIDSYIGICEKWSQE